MDIKLGKDELAIMRWIYVRARCFGSNGDHWADDMMKELGLPFFRYYRAMSFLRELSLLGTERGPNGERGPEDGDWIWLTGQGVNAYRHAVPQEEWDIEYDPEKYMDEDE